MNAPQEQLNTPPIQDRQPPPAVKQWQRPQLRRLNISRDTADNVGSFTDGPGPGLL